MMVYLSDVPRNKALRRKIRWGFWYGEKVKLIRTQRQSKRQFLIEHGKVRP